MEVSEWGQVDQSERYVFDCCLKPEMLFKKYFTGNKKFLINLYTDRMKHNLKRYILARANLRST